MRLQIIPAALVLAAVLQPAAKSAVISNYSIIVPPDALGPTTVTLGGINNLGQVVGSYLQPGFIQRGFVYNGNYTSVAAPAPKPEADLYISGINDIGQYVGVYGQGVPYTGFFHDSTGFHDVVAPSGDPAPVYAINNSGTMVGRFFDNKGRGFIHQGQTWTIVNGPNAASDTTLVGINNAGTILGQYLDAGGMDHSFLYDGTTFTAVDDPDAADLGTFARGLNDKGQVVGYYYDAAGITHGFLFDAGSWTTLDIQTFDSNGTSLIGINNDGVIIGDFIDSSGIESFIVTPEPGTFAMLAAALLLSAATSRCRWTGTRRTETTE